MSYKNKPYKPAEEVAAAPAEVQPSAEVQVAEEVAAVAPEPVRVGESLAAVLRGSINDLHSYGVISDAEAVSIKERLAAKV